MSANSQSFNGDFLGLNRKLDWLEIYLFFDKSDKHTTIYDSHNVEKTAQYIKFVKLENISKTYSITKTIKYDNTWYTETYAL